jgi:hypothetical protein
MGSSAKWGQSLQKCVDISASISSFNRLSGETSLHSVESNAMCWHKIGISSTRKHTCSRFWVTVALLYFFLSILHKFCFSVSKTVEKWGHVLHQQVTRCSSYLRFTGIHKQGEVLGLWPRHKHFFTNTPADGDDKVRVSSCWQETGSMSVPEHKTGACYCPTCLWVWALQYSIDKLWFTASLSLIFGLH